MNVSQEIRTIRNKLSPTGAKNTDILQFDYLLYTELEKYAKKARETALTDLKAICTKPDEPGVIIRGTKYTTELKQTAPVHAFNQEVFIQSIIEKFPKIERHVIRELATAAVVPGKPRSSYVTSEIDE